MNTNNNLVYPIKTSLDISLEDLKRIVSQSHPLTIYWRRAGYVRKGKGKKKVRIKQWQGASEDRTLLVEATGHRGSLGKVAFVMRVEDDKYDVSSEAISTAVSLLLELDDSSKGELHDQLLAMNTAEKDTTVKLGRVEIKEISGLVFVNLK